MSTKTNDQKIPLIYAYLYMKIKKQMRGDRIISSNLRKIIQREILCNQKVASEGGNTKGIPRRYCYDIIKDLIDLKLIENVGKIRNDPIYKENNEKVLEVVERLKEWKISTKLRNDKEVKKKLKFAFDILDEDTLYRVVKSKCDKQLKQVFW